MNHIPDTRQIVSLDALFIGRAELAISLGINDLNHALVNEAIQVICHHAKINNLPVGMFLPSVDRLSEFHTLGHYSKSVT